MSKEIILAKGKIREIKMLNYSNFYVGLASINISRKDEEKLRKLEGKTIALKAVIENDK